MPEETYTATKQDETDDDWLMNTTYPLRRWQWHGWMEEP